MLNLVELPFTELKIDRSFVNKFCEDSECAAIVKNSLRLAQEMGLTTTAEGIERNNIFNAIVEHGCNRLQGFLFSPPVTRDEFRTLVYPTTN